MYKYYKKDYYRPQLVRDGAIDLCGEWNFIFDDEGKGEKDRYYLAFPENALKIIVPFSYETPASGIADEAAHETVWYSRELVLPEIAAGKRVLLNFEGSDYLTRVWVNGSFAGEHEGGYCRFSFDVTSLLKAGKNVITVCCHDSFEMAQPRGKQRWKPESFGCWYVQTSGIWKPVWAEIVDEIHIDYLMITPDVDNAEADLEFGLTAPAGKNLTGLEAEIEITYKDSTVLNEKISVKPGRVVYKAKLLDGDVKTLKCWEPGRPGIYDLKINVLYSGIVRDTVGSYFGMRKIDVTTEGVKINGELFYQKLVLAQNYWPDTGYTMRNEAAGRTDIEIAIAAGFNGMRIHQKIEDERFLMLCDMYGLAVWGEFPAEYEYTVMGAKKLCAEWTEAVMQQYSHPGIITWVPFNESWGVPEVFNDKKQQRFTLAVCELTRAIDGTRPVISNDGWEHTESDIITLHDYDYSGEHMAPRYVDDLKLILTNQVAHGQYKLAFADGFKYRGQPIIMSEYGGVAIEGGDGWGYNGKAKNAEEFVTKYEDLTMTVKAMRTVSGYCYTQLTDLYQEVNGLTDMNRVPKIDLALIKEINDR